MRGLRGISSRDVVREQARVLQSVSRRVVSLVQQARVSELPRKSAVWNGRPVRKSERTLPGALASVRESTSAMPDGRVPMDRVDF